MTINPAEVAWSRNLFDHLAEGGIWGVPRSGLVFKRVGETFVLTEQMPHVDAMPLTPAQLKAFQAEDFEVIKLRFEAAGITVTKGPGL